MADGDKVRVRQEREALAALDAAGLRARLDEEKRRLWNYRFQLGKRQLENTAAIGTTRKRIARINTYLRARELENK
jgi:large subunit ribosomal protein L29